MSKCANCGTELAPGMKFCCECGSPVPQTKICPNCGTELMPSAKFCFNCGTSLNGVQASGATGATVGGHAVVAGDVTSNVTNTTYVTNADETRHVVTCHICGKSLTVLETYMCPQCGKPTCAQHYDEERKMCTSCRDERFRQVEEAFRQTIREELTAGGGRLTQEALGRLRQRRIALGLEENRGRELIAAERRAGEQTLGAKLTETQRILLDKARQLVFNDGKCDEGVVEIDRILRGGVAMTDEIWTVLLPALLVCDEKRGDEIADKTLEDSLPVAFYRIDRALMHGDLPAAERALAEAERIWPDDIQLKCRRIVFTCALYDESEDENYSDKAAELFDALPQDNDDEAEKDPLTASWRRYAKYRVRLLEAGTLYSLDDGETYKALVHGRLTEPRGGPMRNCWAWNEFYEGDRYAHDERTRPDEFHELSYEKAARCYRVAAEEGVGPAMMRMGSCYERGEGVSQSYAEAAKWYEKAANQGDVDAQNQLGEFYYYGRGVAQSYEEALHWYREAADQGHEGAQYSLGWMYEKGQYISQSYEEAVKWYREAAEQDQPDAQCNLASLYEDGKGVAQSYEEAVKWYRKAAEQGHARAQGKMGVMYERGWGVPKSYEEAVKWYRKAADQGLDWTQYNLANCYKNGRGVTQSYAEAAKWYRRAAEQGDADAQNNLGSLYENGKGVPQSYEEAVKWYRMAAEQGLADAQNSLGIKYNNGQGVPQSYEEAARWYRKAAEQGDKYAQNNLGVLFLNGNGVSQSYEEAAKWFRKAVEQGSRSAQNSLGLLCQNGNGVAQSYEEAVKWFRKAAEQGDATAQLCLGAAYVNGQGVPRDFERGISLIQQAARQGEAQAKDVLRQLGRTW